jgi:hypothetical protein
LQLTKVYSLEEFVSSCDILDKVSLIANVWLL